MSAIRIEQNIFKSIVQMANEMNKADHMNRLFDQIKEAFKDAHDEDEWSHVETFEEDGECRQYSFDLDSEHPHINCFSIRIRHWYDEERLEVDADVVTTYNSDNYPYEKDYYHEGDLSSSLEDVQDDFIKHIIKQINQTDLKMAAVMKVAPIITAEIDRLLAVVNAKAEEGTIRPNLSQYDTMCGSIHYRKNRLYDWMFDSFLEENPHITTDDINTVLDKSYNHLSFRFF